MKNNFAKIFPWLTYSISLFVFTSVSAAQTYEYKNLQPQTISRPNVIGDLGGTPVTIPVDYANLLEYDGDPGWGERRTETNVKRTFLSKISSFGFKVYYPSMQVHTNKPSTTFIPGNILSIGINSNSAYGSDGDNFIKNIFKNKIETTNEANILYTQAPEINHDLIRYTPIDIDKSKRRSISEINLRDYDIFFFRGINNQTEVYIECFNLEIPNTNCKMFFNLFPKMKAHVYVLFRRDMLSQWKQIKSSIGNVIFNFETKI